MKIVLIGYMGSGKSAIGKQLSDVLSIPFVDLDTAIEIDVGEPVPEIFKTRGELFFRKKERSILEERLKLPGSGIIATGGGTPCYGNTMEFLKKAPDVITIYLSIEFENLSRRLYPIRHHRPLIAHLESESDLKDYIRKHLFERSFYYNQANTTIITDNRTEREIVELIVASLFE